MTFATLREALRAVLEPAFGFTFQPGELVTPSPDQNLGCIFKTRDQRDPRDGNMVNQQFTVRVILQDISLLQPAPEVALDPTPLEDAADLVLATLQPLRADPSIQDGFLRWTRTDYHNRDRIVDVNFETAGGQSLFAAGG